MFLTTRTIAEINDLQIMQNKALRTCLKVRQNTEVHVSDLHIELQVQPYDRRIQHFLLCTIYRLIDSGIIKPIVPRKSTGLHKAPVLYLPIPKCDTFYKNPTYFGPKTWNILLALQPLKSLKLHLRIDNGDLVVLFLLYLW